MASTNILIFQGLHDKKIGKVAKMPFLGCVKGSAGGCTKHPTPCTSRYPRSRPRRFCDVVFVGFWGKCQKTLVLYRSTTSHKSVFAREVVCDISNTLHDQSGASTIAHTTPHNRPSVCVRVYRYYMACHRS